MPAQTVVDVDTATYKYRMIQFLDINLLNIATFGSAILLSGYEATRTINRKPISMYGTPGGQSTFGDGRWASGVSIIQWFQFGSPDWLSSILYAIYLIKDDIAAIRYYRDPVTETLPHLLYGVLGGDLTWEFVGTTGFIINMPFIETEEFSFTTVVPQIGL